MIATISIFMLSLSPSLIFSLAFCSVNEAWYYRCIGLDPFNLYPNFQSLYLVGGVGNKSKESADGNEAEEELSRQET